ncbi:gliding motility lipoprotein GldH [Polaribacter reichenbachii]|uniref:gliding motility lipoprotein GldH n=1 Tax=Polaribacter reichenbachii TaxID=996801 RepID=UPI000973C1B6|nr:gliding motility lipoprotein GldH [Polaribacter reichenbachii]APZ45381.1 gliding motility lipoprotein GldH [Polaribacter reichenbachii]AUC19242.1 gliding motility lipoprotein GldH [Polaribacter reichenbachii]
METILKKNKLFVFLITLLFLFSCSDKIEFTKYKSLSNASWEANKNISFEFEISDTISPKNLFINLRNNKDYPYSNLYVITELNFPNGDKIIDTLQYEMADNSGQFLGKGFTDIKENKLFYKEEKVFPVSGKYVFNIRHAMRKNGEVNTIPFLQGVQDVGFSIEKTE